MVRSHDALQDTALIAVFAALIAVFSALVPGFAVGPVALTLQTLAVALTGLILGPIRGAAAVLLYLAVGFAGLPVFSFGQAGLGVFGGGSIGYLLSFPFAAALTGALARLALRGRRRWLGGQLVGAALLSSVLLIHPAGIVGLMVNAHLGLVAAVVYDLRFWPGDILKCVLAGLIAVAVHRAFPALAARRGPVAPVVA